MIGPYFDGEDVLDLFAGTGGLGIEALSRGAARAVFVDSDRRAVDTVRANVAAAKFEEAAEIYRNDAMLALKALAKRERTFDLVFLDPPYRMKNADEYLMFMEERGLLREEAIAVIEHETDVAYPESFGRFELKRKAEYGDTAVSIYRYSKGMET